MDKYKVRLTKHAIRQFDNIVDYILNVLQSPTTALNLANALEHAIQSLELMPSRTPFVEEEPWHSRKIHKLLVKNYFVYYWIDEYNLKVQVTCICNTRMDQAKQLKNMDRT